MTSRAWGLAGLFIMLFLIMTCTGCTVIKVMTLPVDFQDSVRKGELRVEWPRGKLYDNGPVYLSAVGDEQWRYNKQ